MGPFEPFAMSHVKRELVDGRMTFREVPAEPLEIECQLVLLALGFLGPEQSGVVATSAWSLIRRRQCKGRPVVHDER